MSPHTILSLVHLLVFVPLLFVLASTTWIPATVTLAIGAGITLYHAFKAWTKISAGTAGAWVNLVHVLIVGPTIAARGALPDSRIPQELLRMIAFAGAGYHGYYLIAG
jgi:hypothetical protein